MKENMISIIVPIYNVRSYLEQCIESIIHQTYKELEIILVDDGSTDGCSEICDHYKALDDRIVVIHKENGGLVSARKTGIIAATGAYIAYVDGDDWIEPDMYETLYKKMVEEDVDVVLTGRYEDTGNYSRKVICELFAGRYNKCSMEEQVYSRMLVGGDFFTWGIFPSVWGNLYKKKDILQFQLRVENEITMGEDAAVVYPLLLSVRSIYVLDECFYHYRQSANSMVKQKGESDLERKRFRILYNAVSREFSNGYNTDNLQWQWRQYMLFLMLARADGLYDGFDELDYLYPFPDIKRGTKIILYGASTYGQRLYDYLRETSFCQVQLWADRNFVELRKFGLNVSSPDEIANQEFDYIVIAVSYAKTIKSIKKELCKVVDEAKIKSIDVETVVSETSMKAFGLTE